MKRTMHMRKGFTLVETLLSMTLLVFAFLLMFRLFHASLRYSGFAEKYVQATIVAGKKMEEVKKWAREGSYNYDTNWGQYSSSTAVKDADNPDYYVKVEARGDAALYTPSSSLEEIYCPPQYLTDSRRKMSGSVMKVRVTVSWDNGDPSKSVTLLSYVRDPQRSFDTALGSMTVAAASSMPSMIPKDGTVSFTVSAADQQGKAMNGLIYRWYVYPLSGNGSVTASHDSMTATFTNRVNIQNSPAVYTGGTCKVAVRAVYYGIEKWAYSPVLNLVGP